MKYIVIVALTVLISLNMWGTPASVDSLGMEDDWCAICYKTITDVDSVFCVNISTLKKRIKKEKICRLNEAEDSKQRDFLVAISYMSDRNFWGATPHKMPRIDKKLLKEIKFWYKRHKYLITLDILRRFYCAVYPPLMNIEEMERYFEELDKYVIRD